jgi:hypothetical protein
MSSQVPKGDRRAAIISGEFVPLTVEEFRNGYATFSDGVDGKLPRDPDFPTEYHDAVTSAAKPVEDTPFNRAWIAAGTLFTDEAKRIQLLPASREGNASRCGQEIQKVRRPRGWLSPYRASGCSRRRALQFQDDAEGATGRVRCRVPTPPRGYGRSW